MWATPMKYEFNNASVPSQEMKRPLSAKYFERSGAVKSGAEMTSTSGDKTKFYKLVVKDGILTATHGIKSK